MTGADVVLAAHDGAAPSFVPHKKGPRGRNAIPLQEPPIDRPSLDHDVCNILDHIRMELGDPQDGGGTDVVKRTKRLSDIVNGHLDYYKAQRGRSLYCVFEKREDRDDGRYWSSVLRRLQDLVPRLIWVELDPDALAGRCEAAFRSCLLLRFQERQDRSSF
jgi:hypothetical protein